MPAEVAAHMRAAGFAHAQTPCRIRRQSLEGERHGGNGLVRISRWYLDSALRGHLRARAAEIEADHRPRRRHGFQTGPSAGIVEAGMSEHVTIRQPRQRLCARQPAPKLHLPGYAQTPRHRFQPRSLRTGANEPILSPAAVMQKTRKSLERQIETLQVQKISDAHNAEWGL